MSSAMGEKYTKEEVLVCEDGCGAIVLNLLDAETIWMGYYPCGAHCKGFWQRAKIALAVLFGRPLFEKSLLYDIVIDREKFFSAAVNLKMAGRSSEITEAYKKIEKENDSDMIVNGGIND